MTLSEFLLARITEEQRHDEALWVTMQAETFSAPASIINLGALVDPRRVLAECEAKRRIVAEHSIVTVGGEQRCSTCCAEWGDYYVGEPATEKAYPCPTVRALAAVYADHPDYDEGWRP